MRKRQAAEIQQKTKAKKPSSIISKVRTILQILFFIWLPSLYIGAFAGLEEIITSVVKWNFSIAEMWPYLLEFLAIIPITILAGRFFCGWMCAFGALTDWIYKIFSRWTKNKIRLTRKADRILKGLKYVVLVVLLLLGWLAGTFSVSAMSPWDAFGMLFTLSPAPALGYVLQSLLPGFIIMVTALTASAFIERFFCRYMCPMGAFFAMTTVASMVYIDKPRDNCGKCQICTRSCAMGIPLHQMDQVKSGECISCMKCVEACPRSNIHVRIGSSAVHPVAIAALVIAIFTGLFMVETVLANYSGSSDTKPISISLSSSADETQAAETAAGSASMTADADTSAAASDADQTASNTTTSATTSAAASAAATTAATTAETTAETTAAVTQGQYADGTFTGSGTGYRGGITTVEVTVSDGQISNISVISHEDDVPYFERAFSSVSSDIMTTQSTNVDIVSHATYSSNGIIEAVSNALSQA